VVDAAFRRNNGCLQGGVKVSLLSFLPESLVLTSQFLLSANSNVANLKVDALQSCTKILEEHPPPPVLQRLQRLSEVESSGDERLSLGKLQVGSLTLKLPPPSDV
jgi:hypothetical protein